MSQIHEWQEGLVYISRRMTMTGSELYRLIRKDKIVDTSGIYIKLASLEIIYLNLIT